MSIWQEWRADRARRQRAAKYVDGLHREPDPADVDWLTRAAGSADADHARWELRYARRALGLLVASRDALDDRTASVVGRALTERLTRDPNVASGKLTVAEQQFNSRLRRYGEALSMRESGEPTGARLGRLLLTLAGVSDPTPDAIARASALLAAYMAELNEQLRAAFGAASLPVDRAPSTIAAR